MADCEGRMDDDLGLIGVGPGSQQGPNDSVLIEGATGAVVEDRKESLCVPVSLLPATIQLFALLT